jgi:hypothetical protein
LGNIKYGLLFEKFPLFDRIGRWTRMKTVTFTITDGNHMSYRDIEVLLAKMNGVERALIDVNDGDLKVEFNEDTIETVKIKQEIERRGFHIDIKE